MDRREFLIAGGGAVTLAWLSPSALGQSRARYDNLLVLIELKGGNDGLNTVIPYADREYFNLRSRIAIARDQVIQLDERTGLHPALKPLASIWQDRELAVVQSVGYPSANLSHFRSIEIWDTASGSNEYLNEGWLTRTFAAAPAPPSFVADGVIVGSHEMGPLSGSGARSLAISNTEQFLAASKLAGTSGSAANPALSHILRVEQDVVRAASGLHGKHVFQVEFPSTGFGNALRVAAQVIASKAGVGVVRVSHNGYDTHSGQINTQQRLLRELAEGMAAMRAALLELGKWQSTLMMTYSEFGRRARENLSGGTDHGTASAHFLAGGRVKGGIYGLPPALTQLDGNGNLPFAVDFRDLYATVIERWWGGSSATALRGRFNAMDLVRSA